MSFLFVQLHLEWCRTRRIIDRLCQLDGSWHQDIDPVLAYADCINTRETQGQQMDQDIDIEAEWKEIGQWYFFRECTDDVGLRSKAAESRWTTMADWDPWTPLGMYNATASDTNTR